MPRTLHDFLGRHRGETAWLFGKGPSLDLWLGHPANARWLAGRSSVPGLCLPQNGDEWRASSADKSRAGSSQQRDADSKALLCCINEVFKEIPGCLYAFANDSVAPWQHVYRPEHILFTPQRTIDDTFMLYGRPPCEVVGYPDAHGDERLAWPPARLAAEGLAIRPGTLGSALQILALMGVTRVVLVGIDGGGRHASRQWHTRLRNEHYKDYDRIRHGAIESAPRLGLTLEFFHPSHNPDGTMKIKITRSTVVRGFRDVTAGEIVDVPEREARILLLEGCAISAPAAPAPTPEAAEAPPAVETAAVAHAPRRRTRTPSA